MFLRSYPNQSPINLCEKESISYHFPEESHIFNWDNKEKGVKVGDGDTCEIAFRNSKSSLNLVLPGNKDATTFRLLKYHIHSRSEHFIEGKQKRIEMHVVHEAQEIDPYNNNCFRSIYAVVAIFIDSVIDPQDKANDEKVDQALEVNKFFESLIEAHKPENANKQIELDEISAAHFLPKDHSKYWRYEGSLTTDKCAPNPEYTSWIVLKESKIISDKTAIDFITNMNHKPKLIQPLDRRYVFFNQPNP